ncbi:MAG: TnpV protein, partial [Oscillospiraceae bacterium]|nr:TnpV protein [Oscillospiraceae bacterium]
RLVLSGKLFQHLAEINQTAEARLELLMNQLKEQNGVTEELKAHNQMQWVAMMNNLKAQAEEMILTELVYS